jgi:hypothetical protein
MCLYRLQLPWKHEVYTNNLPTAYYCHRKYMGTEYDYRLYIVAMQFVSEQNMTTDYYCHAILKVQKLEDVYTLLLSWQRICLYRLKLPWKYKAYSDDYRLHFQ